MTMRKRLPALVLSLLLVLALCACGESKVDYPALDAPDLDTMTLSEVANGSVRAKYDASEWLADPSIDPLTFYYLADTSDEENMVNINVGFLLSGVKRLTEDDMSGMLAELEGEYSNELTIQEKRMCSLDGSAAIYMEGTMQFTDKTIDLMIENGAFTQEEIDAFGDAMRSCRCRRSASSISSRSTAATCSSAPERISALTRRRMCWRG